MLLSYSLIVYLIVLLVMTVIFYQLLGLTAGAAFGLGILIGLIALLIMTPPTSIDTRTHPNLVLTYIIIIILSVIYLVGYFSLKALFDFRDKVCTRGASTICNTI